MKPNYFIRPLMAIIFAATLFGCKKTVGIWKNEQISSGTLSDLHQLKDGVLKDIQAGDEIHLENILDAGLLASKAVVVRKIDVIGTYLKKGKLEAFDEYYTVNKYRDHDTIDNKGRGINSYRLIIPGIAQEMYISLNTITEGTQQFMLQLVFSKYNYGWRLTDVDVSNYKVNDMTAPELYDLAKKQYEQKHMLDAASNISLAYTCLQPTGTWTYPEFPRIKELSDKASAAVKDQLRFPIILRDLPTSPVIFSITPQSYTDGSYCPTVYYLTRVKLADTNAIKQENMGIRKALAMRVPGLNSDKKYVLYSAFNKAPRSSQVVDRFEMVDKLK